MITPDPIKRVSRQFSRALASFDAYRAVFDVTAERLEERLSLLTIVPERILILGSRTGHRFAAIQSLYPKAKLVGVDPAAQALPNTKKWYQRGHSPVNLSADPHQLPFANESFDLVLSNMLLPWCRNPPGVFSEVHRVLAAEGAFFFSSAGPDTLREYRALWAKIDAYLHVFGLVDMHELGDALMKSGFGAPVLDRVNLTIDYPDIASLQHELRALGAANIAQGRRQGLMSPRVKSQIDALAVNPRFSATLELVQGHGWKDELIKPGHNSRDEYAISLDSLRLSLRSGR